MLFVFWNIGEWDGRNNCHISGGGGRDIHSGLGGKIFKLTEGLKDLDVVGEVMLKWILKT